MVMCAHIRLMDVREKAALSAAFILSAIRMYYVTVCVYGHGDGCLHCTCVRLRERAVSV